MENLRGVKIVNKDSLMVENSHLYIKAKDENYCELTIIDENGKKRKVGATHTNSENEIKIIVGTSFASVGQYQRQFNQAVENWKGSIQTQITSLQNSKLDKGSYAGTAQDLKDDIDSKANTSHTHDISSITNLQTALDGKLNIPTLISPYYFGLWNGTTFINGSIGLINEGVRVTSNLLANSMYIGDLNIQPTESLEVNGYVKATGFKTLNGTPNQSLTANGGVFDLNTKADLVGGKVLPSQSQPSTMVMNSSTYVITFTDATGTVQTIDLPLESLFKDVNYDETTKSLIVTLDNGTTKSIPLTDLVDLPEIVLSNTNPAVNPTTGQKVYFNTSLGKVWFNAGWTWSGGYSLINTITSNVTSTTTVGAINAGDIIPAGTNIQKLTELLLNKTFYPTFVNTTFGLTNNAGLREVGSSFNVTLTFNFNRGQILGKLDNGIWNPTMLQDYRAGTATSYLLNGVSGSNNSASFNVTTILGNNPLSGSVTYGVGVQPKDSKNNNYDNPLPSGTSPIQSTSFEGIYPYFYYKSTSPITPEIMQSAIANGQATKVLASSTGTITIPFAANGEYIAVAYPATSTTKTIWYVNALDNGDIPGGLLGAANTLPCNSPTNLWNNVHFKIHVSEGLITQTNPIQLKNS